MFDSALEAAAAIRNREVSPSELLDHHLRVVDELDGELNAFCLRDDERARADARAADQLVASTDDPGSLPPFLGVPIPIKDLNDVEGWPTSQGSLGAGDEPAASDDPAVARLRGAGFVLMGKTATPELGTISYTESQRFGATRNPWDTSRTPGGSSGGAGAAVASGMAPIAHASDGGGSIRIPASCNGLVGLKASRNRISSTAEKLLAATTQGVVSRTVADTAAVLDVLSAVDPGAWNVAPPPSRPFAEEVGADPGRLRVRVTPENALSLPVEDACVDAVRRAADLLADLGHEVVEAPPSWGDPGEFLVGFLTVWSTISAGSVLDPDRLEPHNRANRAAAEATSAIAFQEAAFGLQSLSRTFNSQFSSPWNEGDFDVLLTPTMAVEPPPVGSVWEGSEEDPSLPLTICTPMAAYTALFNVSGLPAISLPLHQSASGLPVGVQLAAGPWQEAQLVRVASQLESAAPWADRRPPISR